MRITISTDEVKDLIRKHLKDTTGLDVNRSDVHFDLEAGRRIANVFLGKNEVAEKGVRMRHDSELTEKQQRKLKNKETMEDPAHVMVLSEALMILEDECSEQDPITIFGTEEIIDSKPTIEDIPHELLEYYANNEDAACIKIKFYSRHGYCITGSLMDMVRDRLDG